MTSAAGRPKVPTAMKKLTGTYRSDRHATEPELPVSLPDRPSWVDEDPLAAQLFDQVTKYMLTMQVSSSVDGLALSMLADQVAMYLRLRRIVLKEGELITAVNSSGNTVVKPHPALNPLNQAFANCQRLLREYGLTASSRANLNAADETVSINTFEDFLNG